MYSFHTVAATIIELGLDYHVGNEMRGLTSLLEEALEVFGGGNVTVLLEFLPNLSGGLSQHKRVSGKRPTGGSQHHSVGAQCLAPHYSLTTKEDKE